MVISFKNIATHCNYVILFFTSKRWVKKASPFPKPPASILTVPLTLQISIKFELV